MKRKVYLVPHTHWDREWYFTKNTGDVLLNHTINDIINHAVPSPMMLDGQFSLLDDYVKWNPNKKVKIKALLKSQVLSCGPFYTQPDLFNSSAETTIRNIEMGQKVGHDFGVNTLKTAYLPDTFGFNQNMPQIFKMKGLKNFVFWRGLPADVLTKTFYFKWQGVDGSKVNAYNLRRGYFSIGSYYPYNGTPFKGNYEMHDLEAKIATIAREVKIKHGPIILPLGGDQAPYLHDAKNIIEKLNKISQEYDYELISNYDKFFIEQNEPPLEFKGDLKTPLASKIHRTISSSRYDIKQLFRIVEDKLYYLLEPLEIFYSQYDNDYSFAKFKEENILKPLLIAQAHDSLGSCNTDRTNRNALQRLKETKDFIISQVDLLMKKIIQDKKLQDKHLAIFNPAPFKNELFERKTIYAKTPKSIFMQKSGLSIYTIATKNISLQNDNDVWAQDVIIYKNNLKPWDFASFTMTNNARLENFNLNYCATIQINKKIINLTLKGQPLQIYFIAIENLGDAYDFSPGKKLHIAQTHKVTQLIKLSNYASYLKMESNLKIKNKTSRVTWDFFINTRSNKIKTNFKIDNKFVNVRISLNIINHKQVKIYKSQHMAITPFIKDDFIKDWKQKYKEYPIHVDHNDGLVNIGRWNIMTRGNNEIYNDSNLQIVLYRTNDVVTKSHMKWRLSPSGLNFNYLAEDAKLLKKLEFNMEFNLNNQTQALNEWKFMPYAYKIQHVNFIANKMSKFIINNILNKTNLHLKIKINPNVFVSSMQRIKTDIRLRIANLTAKKEQVAIIINKKNITSQLKPFEIKEIDVKGVYDAK